MNPFGIHAKQQICMVFILLENKRSVNAIYDYFKQPDKSRLYSNTFVFICAFTKLMFPQNTLNVVTAR